MLNFVVTERMAEFIANLPRNDNGPKVEGKAVASDTETPYVRLMKGDFYPGGNKAPRPYTWIERANNVAASQSLIRINTDLGPALALQIQFRPATEGWEVGPAGGLVDAGEGGAQAAVRETKEEMPVQFSCDPKATPPISAVTSSGITNEHSQLFVGTGKLKSGAEILDNWIITGKTEKEVDEISIAIAIPTTKIMETLAEFRKHEINICARLACYVQGAVDGSQQGGEIWQQNTPGEKTDRGLFKKIETIPSFVSACGPPISCSDCTDGSGEAAKQIKQMVL